MMKDLQSRMAVALSGLAATFALSVSEPAEAQQRDILSSREAFVHLYPKAVAIGKGDLATQQQATANLINAQRDIQNLFGPGQDGSSTFTHNGRTLTASYDCDDAFMTVGKGGFVLTATPKFMENFHAVINGATASIDYNVEKRMLAVSASALMPLDHPDASAYKQHMFAPAAGENYRSAHNIDQGIVNRALNEVCGTKLNALNTDLQQNVLPALKAEGFFQPR